MSRSLFKEEHDIFRDAFKKFLAKEVIPIFAGTTEVIKVVVGRMMGL